MSDRDRRGGGPTRRLRWTIVAPSLARPAGGVIALLELANELVRQGQQVQLLHVPTAEARLESVAELDVLPLEPAIEHSFSDGIGQEPLPAADVLLYTTMVVSTALATPSGDAGRRFVDVLRTSPAVSGLPVLVYQGRGVFPAADEELAVRLPGPKVCVGSELAAHLLEEGVPRDEVVYIPNGVDHSAFRIRRDVTTRAPRVAMNFDAHPVKGGDDGLEAIDHVHRELGVPATVFSTRPLLRALPPGVDLVLAPRRPALAEIYNDSTVFLQPSRREGFGMCAVEAMACGSALVTTDNGGSSDYAFDGETAVVCGHAVDAMTAALTRVCGDDELRTRIALRGAELVQRFHWSSSARRLIDLALHRLGAAEPSEDVTP